MFNYEKELNACSHEEIEAAKVRYYNALSISIRGTGSVFLKRKVKDIFTNGYNMNIMRLHEANHDFQVVIDQYACEQYVCGYLQGVSKKTQEFSCITRIIVTCELFHRIINRFFLLKTEVHTQILNTELFLCNFRASRYQQNKMGFRK